MEGKINDIVSSRKPVTNNSDKNFFLIFSPLYLIKDLPDG